MISHRTIRNTLLRSCRMMSWFLSFTPTCKEGRQRHLCAWVRWRKMKFNRRRRRRIISVRNLLSSRRNKKINRSSSRFNSWDRIQQWRTSWMCFIVLNLMMIGSRLICTWISCWFLWRTNSRSNRRRAMGKNRIDWQELKSKIKKSNWL